MSQYINQSNGVEWSTPIDLYGQLVAEFGEFDLDPCANDDNAKAPRYFTLAEDGLVQKWDADRIYVNPPYGRGIGKWVRKAYEASQAGALVVCLVPSRTDVPWFHEYALKGEIRFIRGRLRFANSKKDAPFPSMLVIFYPRSLEAIQHPFDSFT